MMPETGTLSVSSPGGRPRAATAAQPTTASPRVVPSRRPSQVMGPPASLSQAVYTGSPPTDGATGIASGPLRHPKPLTPSDLHSMLEKEQEAMVNRLSRELSSLRQQTTSVASTASSTSTSFNDADGLHSSPYLSGSIHPTASRRHRSSSSLSSSYVPAVQGSRTGSVAGIAPSRDTGLPISRTTRSRETSITSPRQSDAPLSSLSSSLQQQGDSFPHRASITQQGTSPAAALARYEETAQHRGEYESIKRENEALRKRVRELENTLKKHRDGESKTEDSAPSTSALTNAMRNASVANNF